MTYAQQRAREIHGEFTLNQLGQLIAELRHIHADRRRRTTAKVPEPLPAQTRGPAIRLTITDIDGNGVQTCRSL